MSRSALWRQEVNIKERARVANETFQIAVDEGRRCHVKGQIPLIGPDDTFNINPMLLRNIAKSPYFIKCCQNLQEWGALVDEIYYEVKHMEPWADGGSKVPSSAFCLLLRLFTLRCSEKQMTLMLNHVDSPYIRCIGFLYLRYATEPSALYSFYEPYLYDEEPVRIYSNPSRPETTIGEYVKSLLKDMNYYGTVLPRLPVVIEREVKVKLMQEKQSEDRALDHLRDERFMEYCQNVGCKIRALYGDEENPTTWYDCVVDRIIRRDDTAGMDLVRPKFVVTFPEYGNTETVTLGEIDWRSNGSVSRGGQNDYKQDRGQEWNRDKKEDWNQYDRERDNSYKWRKDSRAHDSSRKKGYNDERGYNTSSSRSSNKWDSKRGYSERSYTTNPRERNRSRSREREIYDDRGRSTSSMKKKTVGGEDLMEEIRRQEREKSTANGKNYSRKHRSFAPTTDNRSSSRNDNSDWRERELERAKNRHDKLARNMNQEAFEDIQNQRDIPKKEKSPEEIAAIQERKRKLLTRYG